MVHAKWIAEELENKLCDPESLLRPGFYAHPGLGLLKEPVLAAQAVFNLPQSVSPPEAKNAEIVRAFFEESGQPALHPDVATADLLAYVNATTQAMAAVADHLVARAQAAASLMGAAADNIVIFNERQYLRFNSGTIDTALRTMSSGIVRRLPGLVAGSLTPAPRCKSLRANCLSCYRKRMHRKNCFLDHPSLKARQW